MTLTFLLPWQDGGLESNLIEEQEGNGCFCAPARAGKSHGKPAVCVRRKMCASTGEQSARAPHGHSTQSQGQGRLEGGVSLKGEEELDQRVKLRKLGCSLE